jgi:hypothetical protein
MLLSFGRSCPSIMQNRRSWKPPIPRGRNVVISDLGNTCPEKPRLEERACQAECFPTICPSRCPAPRAPGNLNHQPPRKISPNVTIKLASICRLARRLSLRRARSWRWAVDGTRVAATVPVSRLAASVGQVVPRTEGSVPWGMSGGHVGDRLRNSETEAPPNFGVSSPNFPSLSELA